METADAKDLKLIPIVGQLSSRGRGSDIFRSIAEKYHYIEFHPRMADALTSFTMTLQAQIARCKNRNRRIGESQIMTVETA